MDWKDLKRHPLSAEYRDISGPAWFRFTLKLKKHGILGGRKITLHEGMILDGWQLHRGCLEVGIEPDFETLGEGTDPREFVEAMNDERRHETADEAAERVKKRRERVSESRVNGKSTRTIAEEEGISHTQVNRDLESASTGTGVPVEPQGGKVTGKDNRERPATSKPKILCVDCQKREKRGVPLIEKCEGCKLARKAAKKKAEESKPPPADDDLPKSVKNALADQWHAECARLLSKMRTECKGAFSWSSWLDASILDHLKAAEELFITAIPRRPCPDCKGQKQVDKVPCQTCRHGGYLASQV